MDEAHTSMESLVRFMRDHTQMTSLKEARDKRGERALVALLESRTQRGEQQGVLFIKKVHHPAMHPQCTLSTLPTLIGLDRGVPGARQHDGA